MSEVVTLGDCTLIHGDCREVLPTLGRFDAVITDPPYGIGIANNPVRQAHARMDWDTSTPDADLLDALRQLGDVQIIWGGNYFHLPPSQCFLVWDKVQPQDFSLAMCELAWCSKKAPAKMHKQSVLSYRKEHPTQKPVELMEWCIEQAGNPQTILDPFAGSGTTGVAAAQMGKTFVGIERERKYFDIMCERIRRVVDAPPLFPFAYGKAGKGTADLQGDLLAPPSEINETA